ncbi:MAG: hypothetical protein JWM10_1329, partial [Myxococcaceae bacterium]|nr:hypothetical protein [Myxococcaceae bacterium]
VAADRAAVVVRGPWQRLPVARWSATTTLGRWDDAPDFDGDGVPDEVLALDSLLVQCEVAHRDVPCPDPADGSAGVALIARFSADVGAAPQRGRLFGLQRGPSARVEAVRFGEFGRGVSARTTVVVDRGAGQRDTLDRLDLYLGAGLDRPAGTLVHRCYTAVDGELQRAGAIAVALPSESTTLWRFASAHPYSDCATDAVALDASLGRTLARGVRVLDLRASVIETHREVRVAVVDGRARALEFDRRGDAGFEGDPLSLGRVRVVAVARRCDFDLVRYQHEDKSCLVRVERPRSEGRCDPSLAPVAASDDAHPVALVPGADATMPALVLHRGGSLVSAQLPAACGTGRQSVAAEAFHGPVPVGTPVATDGATVLFADGRDLWLARVGDPRPALVNVPGDGLPRGTVRAIAFLDARRVAVVIARSLFEFTLDVPSPMADVPTSLRLDADELYRSPR